MSSALVSPRTLYFRAITRSSPKDLLSRNARRSSSSVTDTAHTAGVPCADADATCAGALCGAFAQGLATRDVEIRGTCRTRPQAREHGDVSRQGGDQLRAVQRLTEPSGGRSDPTTLLAALVSSCPILSLVDAQHRSSDVVATCGPSSGPGSPSRHRLAAIGALPRHERLWQSFAPQHLARELDQQCHLSFCLHWPSD